LNIVNNSETGIGRVKAGNTNYILTKEFLSLQTNAENQIYIYDDSPAINAGLEGAIIEINGIKINSMEKLSQELAKYIPGESVEIRTKFNESTEEHDIILGESAKNPGSASLGVGSIIQTQEGL